MGYLSIIFSYSGGIWVGNRNQTWGPFQRGVLAMLDVWSTLTIRNPHANDESGLKLISVISDLIQEVRA